MTAKTNPFILQKTEEYLRTLKEARQKAKETYDKFDKLIFFIETTYDEALGTPLFPFPDADLSRGLRFTSTSVIDAVREYLVAVGKPQTLKDILNGLQQGNFNFPPTWGERFLLKNLSITLSKNAKLVKPVPGGYYWLTDRDEPNTNLYAFRINTSFFNDMEKPRERSLSVHNYHSLLEDDFEAYSRIQQMVPRLQVQFGNSEGETEPSQYEYNY
jgi:hypothetical protein